MRNKRLSGYMRLLIAATITAFPFAAEAKPDSQGSATVKVSGLVENPFTITTSSVKQLKVAEGENTAIVCGTGETRKTLKTYKGVLLRDILD